MDFKIKRHSVFQKTYLRCLECIISFYCVSLCFPCHYKSFSGIYLTKETSINIWDPKLPEVGQLTDHHVRQLLHKLNLLWGFEAPVCNKDTVCYTNPLTCSAIRCAGRWSQLNWQLPKIYLTSRHNRCVCFYSQESCVEKHISDVVSLLNTVNPRSAVHGMKCDTDKQTNAQ